MMCKSQFGNTCIALRGVGTREGTVGLRGISEERKESLPKPKAGAVFTGGGTESIDLRFIN